MKLLFELSQEYNQLPTDEIFSCLQAEQIPYSIIEANKNIVLISTTVNKNKISQLSQRLALTFYINKFVFSSDPTVNTIRDQAEKNPITPKGTIRISSKNRSVSLSSPEIVRTLAQIYTKNRDVDLEEAEVDLRVVLTDKQIYVGEKLFTIDRKQFNQRKVQNRPFFHPISLHPKIARTLVNLSAVPEKATILDPFCGTGGILLEAGLMNMHIIGCDIEEKMIQGCQETFKYYHLNNYNLYCCDIGKIVEHVDQVDGIVTDLPYGKSTTTKGEKIQDLYDRAFQSFSDVLKPEGRAVVGLSDKKLITLGENYLSLREVYPLKVHRSLTRYFTIFQR
jgi:tRNA (guanine10-N2)-dimethyltransferase